MNCSACSRNSRNPLPDVLETKPVGNWIAMILLSAPVSSSAGYPAANPVTCVPCDIRCAQALKRVEVQSIRPRSRYTAGSSRRPLWMLLARTVSISFRVQTRPILLGTAAVESGVPSMSQKKSTRLSSSSPVSFRRRKRSCAMAIP